MPKTPKLPEISTQIWDTKYRFKKADGTPIDVTIPDSWSRVAKALSAVETPAFGPEDTNWQIAFFNILEDFQYLPAGRILSGAGTGRDVTLFNCYVMGTIPDSMSGIFAMLREAALTMQQGGGIGYDFSTIRPKNAEVKGVAADASGPLTFMDVWDAMCRTVMSAGERRGAMMATMRCDHPDIEAFVEAKQEDASRLRMFNLSVLVTDDFMEAVKNDEGWGLFFEGRKYGKIRARDLWNKILKSTYDAAEPGVIFIDRINELNNLGYCETISATNPCGEQPLPPYGACLLGSINLTKMVDDPFTPEASINYDRLDELVGVAVRMMDNVVDTSLFPIPQQKEEAKAKRRIGLGITGLADALVMCGVKYGTENAAALAKSWQRDITLAAYRASIELAKEKGAFPAFDAKGFLRKGSFAEQRLPKDMKKDIRKHGIRNALLVSIAPTGTISMYAGNVSSGVEPIFAYAYDRKILNGDGTHRIERVEDYAYALYKQMWMSAAIENSPDGKHSVDEWSDELLPYAFTNAQELTPAEHLLMQSAVQHWIDSSISKTINCPRDIPFEEFRNVYQMAYDSGCKGCTTYRPNDVTGSILSIASEEEEITKVTSDPVQTSVEIPRPDRLEGATYKLVWPNTAHAMYISFSDIRDADDTLRPYEIFINTKDVNHTAWTVALTRMISGIFRRGSDVSFVASELREVFDPKGGAYMRGKFVPSLLAAIGDVIAEHMESIGYGDFRPKKTSVPPVAKSDLAIQAPMGDTCPSCGGYDFRVESGCKTCQGCGHSKCG